MVLRPPCDTLGILYCRSYPGIEFQDSVSFCVFLSTFGLETKSSRAYILFPSRSKVRHDADNELGRLCVLVQQTWASASLICVIVPASCCLRWIHVSGDSL